MTKADKTTRLFDSANFVVFNMQAEIIGKCLKNHSLSTTQLTILLKLAELGKNEVPIQEIAALLYLQPTVVTIAANTLVDHKLADRRMLPSDLRSRYLLITETGKKKLKKVDTELHDLLDDTFKASESKEKETLLERGLRVEAQLGDMWKSEFVEKYPSATSLVSVSAFLRLVEQMLHKNGRLTLSEGRVLQRLEELSVAMRIGDLSTQLRLPAATITRAAKKLENGGYVDRLTSEQDRKALFLDLTDAGMRLAHQVESGIERLGQEWYWGKLSAEELSVANQIKRQYLDTM